MRTTALGAVPSRLESQESLVLGEGTCPEAGTAPCDLEEFSRTMQPGLGQSSATYSWTPLVAEEYELQLGHPVKGPVSADVL